MWPSGGFCGANVGREDRGDDWLGLRAGALTEFTESLGLSIKGWGDGS